MSQHQQRPRDILEFLRRTSGDEPAVEVAPEPGPQRPPHVTVSSSDAPMVVLRRSQVIVACVAAGLLIVLAFLLGLTSAGEGGEAANGATASSLYTIKLIEYPATRNGEVNAKTLKAELERVFDEDVTIQRLDRDRTLFVALGCWLSNPRENRQAQELLARVKKLAGRGSGDRPFEGAYFFPIKR